MTGLFEFGPIYEAPVDEMEDFGQLRKANARTISRADSRRGMTGQMINYPIGNPRLKREILDLVAEAVEPQTTIFRYDPVN